MPHRKSCESRGFNCIFSRLFAENMRCPCFLLHLMLKYCISVWLMPWADFWMGKMLWTLGSISIQCPLDSYRYMKWLTLVCMIQPWISRPCLKSLFLTGLWGMEEIGPFWCKIFSWMSFTGENIKLNISMTVYNSECGIDLIIPIVTVTVCHLQGAEKSGFSGIFNLQRVAWYGGIWNNLSWALLLIGLHVRVRKSFRF